MSSRWATIFSPSSPDRADALPQLDPARLDRAWAAWAVRHNRRALVVAATLVLTFHPVFAALDRFVIPEDALRIVWSVRAASSALALAAITLRMTAFFERHMYGVASGLIVSAGLSICVMTHYFGGLRSPYSNGLMLVMFGAGLVFLWPLRAAALTHGAMVAGFVLLNLSDLSGHWSSAMAIPLFFVSGTAVVVATGQQYAYQRERQVVADQLRLELAGEQLREAAEEIRLRERFKSRFFANLTHELKTPLAMILSPLELLIDGELGSLTEGQRATLRAVYRNGAQLLKLIGDLLDLSRIEESRLRLRIAEHDIVDYLRGLCQQCGPLVERKRITLDFVAQGGPQSLWIDVDRMERVFVNLLSNAARFTPTGGRIVVCVEARRDEVVVSVEDNGPGFPPEEAERIFERFYQVASDGSTNRQEKGGTGIGLALARELVDLHGGVIRASSSPGRGARFEVVLRRGRDHLSGEVLERRTREREVAAERRESPMADFTRDISAREEFRLLDLANATERRIVARDQGEANLEHTVLVVEDTPDVARLIHLTLHQSMRVLIAPDGVKGLELAHKERPDIIVTDLMMPVMDGLELTRRIRTDETLSQTPIIMLTARGDLEDRLAGVETGVNAYLTKPFSPRELLATVRGNLRRNDAALTAAMRSQMASLETVAGGLAHEINNPLNYIKQAVLLIERDLGALGAIDAVAADPRAAAARARIGKFLDTARSGVTRIAGTVAVMQRYAKDGFSRALQRVDLFALVRDASAIVVPATGSRAKLTLDLAGDGVVYGVGDELQQVVSNLLQNAVEATPESNGRVHVRGRVEEGVVELRVTDNGPGVAPENRQKIFKPFFTTKDAGRGMGMGLSIVWRVVHEHRGEIFVTEAPDGGALFVVRIPTAAVSEARMEAETQ